MRSSFYERHQRAFESTLLPSQGYGFTEPHLGEGGNGTVYRGTKPSTAIKFVPKDFDIGCEEYTKEFEI
jgi:hypothetical protein